MSTAAPVAAPPDAPFRDDSGRLCLDFIRTLRYRGRPHVEEELATPQRLARWVQTFGPVRRVRRDPDAGAVGDAHALREAIWTLIAAARGTGGVAACPPAARRAVNTAAAQPVPAPYLTPGAELDHRAGDPIEATLALVARDALDLVASPELALLKECADPSCRTLFVDRSRPGTRRWCSMERCGNRAKQAGRRARAT